MINKNNILITLGLGASLLNTTGCTPNKEKESKSKRPNIVFLLTDDQRYSAVNALGENQIISPTMDNIVKKGTTFTHAHIMGSFSGAVSMPSRAMLLTSKHVFSLHETGKNLPKDHTTLPESLKNNGYNTFETGKWHNGKKGFARSFTAGENIFHGGMSDHMKVPIHDFQKSGKYKKADRYIGKKFSSELFTDGAVNYINNYKDEKPFFMYVAYTAPHDPRMAPKKYLDMYDPSKIVLPPNYMDNHPFDNGEIIIRDELLAPFPRTKPVIQKEIAGYYAMITHLDDQIKRVIDALKKNGQYENTIIVFAGDNGLAVGQHGLVGKQNLYDHSVRVPLTIAGPGIKENVKTKGLCYLNDVFPTLCDLTGTKTPKSVEGISLLPQLKDPKKELHKSVFFIYKNFQRGVRTSDGWKMIKYLVKGKKTTQLFNLNNDPWELNNLANDKKYKKQLKRLTKEMKRWMKKSGDSVVLEKDDWNVDVVESWVDNRKRRGLPLTIQHFNSH